ncbi:hypothetical protein LEP1GSC108_0683 [Leptospira weilii str. UI 13098]|uniref:Uncharacterized protein n=1 Tax=Leptospira weilii str. UI 13098 TaxID=1088542 RepID=M6PXN7_9LEPT|nr:hypothetical protein LEP1GSC108_0683 [Leptospira weilii str. UI 13098]
MYFLPSEFIRIPGQYLRGSDIFEDFFGMFRLQADGPRRYGSRISARFLSSTKAISSYR